MMLQWLILLTLFVHNSLALGLYDAIDGTCFQIYSLNILLLGCKFIIHCIGVPKKMHAIATFPGLVVQSWIGAR
jgi:hypothetical protein